VQFFFNLKPIVQSIIDPKTPRKHSKNLNKPIRSHKNSLKNQNQPKTKSISPIKSTFLGKEKEKNTRVKLIL
jgi:hypothetical protein